MARPKAFDPDQALDKAMRLFLVTGYLGTSMDDLVRAMGISRASLYDTFGSKDDLFRAALERYLALETQTRCDVCSGERTARGYFGRLFDYFIAQHRGSAIPTGCFLISSAVERWHLPEDTQARVVEVLTNNLDLFRQLLQDAKSRGEIRGEVEQLAAAMLATVIALRTMSRSGLDEAILRATAAQALAQLN